MLRKFTTYTAMAILAVWSVRAQSTDTLSVESFFSHLDTSRIPTGILMNKVLAAGPGFYNSDGTNPEAPILTCYGTLDNLWLLRQGMLNNTSFPSTTTLVDSSQRYLAREGEYPILLVDYDYSILDSLAITNQLLTLQDSILVDGPIFSSSPYHTGRFFTANVLDSFYVHNASFVFDQQFYYSNTGIPQEIEIDFGDGIGFRSVNFGTPISPSFDDLTPTYDGKTAIMTVRIRKNGQWVSVSFKTQVVSCNTAVTVPTPSPAPWLNGDNFRYGNISAQPFDVSPIVQGNAYVHYRANPEPGEESLFKKPIIIIEGFETGNYDPNKAENFRMGDLGWCELWGGAYGILNESPLKESPQLFNQLHNDGYDIIMLDFKDSKRSIINNAALVRELILKVNQFKTSDADPNIVIGASAGGLISRYALAYMEQQNEDHCTNLWMTLDSPHKGANISLGAQYLLDFLANNSARAVSEAQVMLQALNSTAAQQLLIYNVFQTNKGYYPTNQSGFPAILVDDVSQNHINFRNTMENMGYPQKLKKVAIASGSSTQQDQGFSGITQLYKLTSSISGWRSGALVSGGLFLNYWDSGLLFMTGELEIRANFLGLIPVLREYDKRSYRNPANISSLDRVPGGFRKLAPEIRETVAKTNMNDLNLIIGTNTFYHRDQCFVPTISALDLNTTNYFFDIQNALDLNSLPTPFDFVYVPDGNTMHVEITDGTTLWKGNNIEYTLGKIHLVEPASNPILTSSYNYGEANLVTHSEVINNGKLHLYGNFSDSKTGLTPASGNTHYYKLGSGCQISDLRIEQSGELILGDATTGNKAELYVQNEASLIVGSNGKIKINNGSSIIIEDGANFIFEDGAQIELLGPNASLEIKGKLKIGNNANFSFSGNGQLIFDQDVKWATNSFGHSYPKVDEYIEIGDDASFDLAGPTVANLNHLLVEVRKPLYLRQENGKTFANVAIQNGQVLLGKDALLFSFSPTNVMYVHFKSIDPNERHSGFRLWHNNGINTILHSKFSGGKYGALVH